MRIATAWGQPKRRPGVSQQFQVDRLTSGGLLRYSDINHPDAAGVLSPWIEHLPGLRKRHGDRDGCQRGHPLDRPGVGVDPRRDVHRNDRRAGYIHGGDPTVERPSGSAGHSGSKQGIHDDTGIRPRLSQGGGIYGPVSNRHDLNGSRELLPFAGKAVPVRPGVVREALGIGGQPDLNALTPGGQQAGHDQTIAPVVSSAAGDDDRSFPSLNKSLHGVGHADSGPLHEVKRRNAHSLYCFGVHRLHLLTRRQQHPSQSSGSSMTATAAAIPAVWVKLTMMRAPPAHRSALP